LRAKTNIISRKDLVSVVGIILSNWYLLIFIPAISFVLAYFYTHQLPEVYAARCQVLLKSRETYDYQGGLFRGLGVTSSATSYGQTASQMNVVRSSDLIEQVLNNLSIDVSYFIVGRLKTTEVYKHLPFEVSVDDHSVAKNGMPFMLNVKDEDSFSLRYEIGGVSKDKSFRFGQLILEDGLYLTINKKGNLTGSSLSEVVAANYMFKVYQRNQLVGRYKGNITVTNVDYTSIIEITLRDNIPSRAREVLSELSRIYIENTVSNQIDINENTIEYIDRQLIEVTDIISEIEAEMEAYRNEKSILDLGYEEGTYFSALNRLDAEKEKIHLEVETMNDLTSYLLQNEDIESLLPPSAVFVHASAFLVRSVENLYGMRQSHREMTVSGTSQNKLIQLNLERIKEQKEDILRYITDQEIELNKRLKIIDQEISSTKYDIRGLPKTQRQMMNIERRIEVNEDLYSYLLSKRAETVIAKAGLVPETKLIEKPRSIGIVAPDKERTQMLSTLIAFAAAIVIILVKELFFQKIKLIGQLQSLTDLTVLGSIPKSKNKDGFIVSDSAKDQISQAFRVLRTNLQFLTGTQSSSIILVTSLMPGEGKTFVTINMATILAMTGKRVLIIDFDLHKPRLAKALKMTNTSGVSNVLIDQDKMEDAIQSTYLDTMDVLLSGPVPPNPSELIMSKKMNDVFDYANQNYDYVLLDTPPISLISDGIVLMQKADAKLFVVNARVSTKVSIDYIEELVEKNAISNAALILNEEKVSRMTYYYSKYGYGYGYGYGYSYGYSYGDNK